MYTWNASVKAMQSMKKVMNMSQRQWQNKLKVGRRAHNPVERKRQQLKNIAKKIAFNQPIYGLDKKDQAYRDLANVF